MPLCGFRIPLLIETQLQNCTKHACLLNFCPLAICFLLLCSLNNECNWDVPSFPRKRSFWKETLSFIRSKTVLDILDLWDCGTTRDTADTLYMWDTKRQDTEGRLRICICVTQCVWNFTTFHKDRGASRGVRVLLWQLPSHPTLKAFSQVWTTCVKCS